MINSGWKSIVDGVSVSLLEFVISSSTNCFSSEKDKKGFIESFVLVFLVSVLLSVLLSSKELNGFYVCEKYNHLD